MSDSRVPLLDLAAQNGPLAGELRAAMNRVVESNHFIMGPEVQSLEKELAEYLGVPHAVGVSSGTDALLLALMALDIGPGDEVVTTPFSFFATAGCIVRVGARPVFVDIDPVTFNLNPAGIEAAITERTKAILPVHLFGQPYDAAIDEVAKRRGIAVIEDAAQAIGATAARGPVGGLGTFGCFSFFPSKNLGAFGDGGLVTATDPELAQRARVLRLHGAEPKYFHALVGGNFRLDALQAAILRVKLPHLDGWMAGRRDNAARYDRLFADAGLAPELLVPPSKVEAGHVYNQYVVRTSRRDALREHLSRAGIESMIYYPRPLHLQQCFADLGHREGDLPEAERACREVLALPVYPELPESDVGRVAESIVAFLKEG